jgi:hypothetical protein
MVGYTPAMRFDPLASPVLLCLLASAAGLGCQHDAPPPLAPHVEDVGSATATAGKVPTREPVATSLDRDTWNRLAVRANAPYFWKADANRNGVPDPEEVASLLFYGTGAFDGADATSIADLTLRLERLEKGTRGEDADADRLARVNGDLDAAAPTLVETDLRAASPGDRAFTAKMLQVAALVDRLYAQQKGVFGLAKDVAPGDDASLRLLARNWGPRCATPKFESDLACTAIRGVTKAPVDVYPAALQRDPKFCAMLEKAPDAAELLSPFTAVRAKAMGSGVHALEAVPYSVAYGETMRAVANALEEAAATLDDKDEEPQRAYLRAAAESFRTNDWNPADEAWARLNAQNSKWYVRVAPDEVYWEPCSHKAGFHLTFARINQGSLAWQEKLVPVRDEMEKALATRIGAPYAARKVTFHLPDFIDIVANAGDSRDPIGATIGQSLPNWGPIAAEGRGRTVAMSNLYTDPDSRAVRKEKAESLLTKEAMAFYGDDPAGTAGLVGTILHEATHNLGPSHAYVYGGKTDAQAFGGDLASMMEELKAQTGGLYYLAFAEKKGIVSPELAKQAALDGIVWAFGHVARGMWGEAGQRKAYGQLAAIQLGMLVDAGAIAWDPQAPAANGTDIGAFIVRFDKLPAAFDAMMKKVGTLKATNDKAGALTLAKKYVEGKAVPHAAIQERILRFPQPSFVYAVRL